MHDESQVATSRKQVAIRLLYTLLYVAIFELVKTIVLLITLFEYFFLLVTLRAQRARQDLRQPGGHLRVPGDALPDPQRKPAPLSVL